MTFLRVLALSLLLVPHALAQQNDPAAFAAKVEAAAQQMDTDLPGAIAALDRLAAESVDIRRGRPLSAAERPIHSRLYLLRARADIQNLDNAKAEENIRELLRIDAAYSGQLAPREQEIFDAVRQRETGIVEIGSRERGSRVLVEGNEVGTIADAPIRTRVVAGTYEVRVEKPGYKPATAKVVISAGQTFTITDLTPVRNVPPLAFLTDVDEVEVVADNVSVGRTTKLAALRTQIPPEAGAALDRATAAAGLDPRTAAALLVRDPAVDKNVTVRFRRDCFIEETRAVAITTDVLTKLQADDAIVWLGDSSAVRMRRDLGALRVTSSPSDADVYLDGQLAGRTPFDRETCAGARRVRVRHRVGSYSVTLNVATGRTQALDITLKPDLAFLGASEGGDAIRSSPETATLVDRALGSAITSFHLAAINDVPGEGPRWSDQNTTELATAASRNDDDAVARLLRQASSSFDSPLLLSALRRPGTGGGEASLDLLLFWAEHAAIDRIHVANTSEKAVAAALGAINAPTDSAALVFHADAGLRVADTTFAGAPLMIVSVQPGSPAAASGIKPGDSVLEIDGSKATAAQFVEALRRRQPGDILKIKVGGAANDQPRDVQLPVQRRPGRAPVLDANVPGNALLARLSAASQMTAGGDRDVLVFNLALVYMRFGEWRRALDLLTPLGNIPSGDGVGRGAALYLRGRCHEELGERDKAMALYRDASMLTDDLIGESGENVAVVARARLAALAELPTR